MIYQSLIAPAPPVPNTNAHDVVFHNELFPPLPSDTLVYVDNTTGEQWTKSVFEQRVVRLATALVADPTAGGLGLKPDTSEIVGIYSKNHVVSSEQNVS